MNVDDAFLPVLEACRSLGVKEHDVDADALAPALTLATGPGDWLALATAARTAALRWCAFWVRNSGTDLEAFSCFQGGRSYLVMRCRLARDEALPSLATIYANADRPERHAHDLFGIQFTGQPDTRRWTRHRAWGESRFPMRPDFQAPAEDVTPTDHEYAFVQAHGPGVMEFPVGPIHAGIIEPGHFRFQAVGEVILNLEERLGYVHKGIEKIAEGRDADGLARLAGRVSGDSTAAHAWAACQALERAARNTVPDRGTWLRAIITERERVANHMGDIGAICNDAAFVFAQYQLTRLKEDWMRENSAVFGHRLLMDLIVPGGTAVDITAVQAGNMIETARALAMEVAGIVRVLEDSESLEDRLMRTGRVSPEQAQELGLVGYVGKASGQPFDVRVDVPYAPYDRVGIRVPHFRAGDVAARAKVRAEEVGISLELITRLLETLPAGPHRCPWRPAAHECEGLGMVEGWRGEILSYVRLDGNGRVTRFFPRDPSWLLWPALELCVQGNIVPDFPLCNKSINGSYSGHDL